MKSLTTRNVASVIGWALIATGVIGSAELVHSSQTSLRPTSGLVYGLSPGLLLLGLIVLWGRRLIDPRAEPSPAGLVVIGVVLAAVPAMIWAAGTAFAPRDETRWGTVIAISLLVLAVPGIGMIYGGIRNWFTFRGAPPPSKRVPTPKVRRRK